MLCVLLVVLVEASACAILCNPSSTSCVLFTEASSPLIYSHSIILIVIVHAWGGVSFIIKLFPNHWTTSSLESISHAGSKGWYIIPVIICAMAIVLLLAIPSHLSPALLQVFIHSNRTGGSDTVLKPASRPTPSYQGDRFTIPSIIIGPPCVKLLYNTVMLSSHCDELGRFHGICSTSDKSASSTWSEFMRLAIFAPKHGEQWAPLGDHSA